MISYGNSRRGEFCEYFIFSVLYATVRYSATSIIQTVDYSDTLNCSQCLGDSSKEYFTGPRLSGLIGVVPRSPDNRGCTVVALHPVWKSLESWNCVELQNTG